MKKTTTDLYCIRCITNLHVGSGDTNYGIVDKEVQKDPIDKMPVIHASGLKGAFREAFDTLALATPDAIIKIFGSDSKSANQQSQGMKAGSYIFTEANLLFYPLRAKNEAFYYGTTPDLIGKMERLSQLLPVINPFSTSFRNMTFPNDLNNNQEGIYFKQHDPNEKIEGKTLKGVERENISFDSINILKSKIAVIKDVIFKNEIIKQLPIIARNHLDNGISDNLWYEEYVPKESIFYFFVNRPEGSDEFQKGVLENNSIFQIGGNASVGYGLCKIIKL